MIQTFLATLTPMLTLFSCILIGFVLQKTNILPENSSKIMSKLTVWVFYPALSFCTMARFFNLSTVKTHATNIIISSLSLIFSISISILLSRFFVKTKCYDRGVYQYALAFANSGYMGDPLVEAIFGSEVLSYYKLACLPISIAIYTWGVSILVPSDNSKKGGFIKKLMNPPLIAMFLGMIVGLICGALSDAAPVGTTAYDAFIPSFITKTLDSLKACMGPTAMLLAGVTIAKYSLKSMFKKTKVYIASALRLIILPAVVLGAMFGIKELGNILFGLSIDNTPIFLLFFAIAAPLGLNTVVFPEAYGGDPESGASMAMISHTLCVITIPIMFSLLCSIFGYNTWLPI